MYTHKPAAALALFPALHRFRHHAPASRGLFFSRTRDVRRHAPACVLVAALALGIGGRAAAQEPCVPAPLFSGNVALNIPYSTSEPHNAWSCAIGDFESDGPLDLVYGSRLGSLIYFRGRPNWWEFEPPVIIDLPFAPPPPGGSWPIDALAAADLNADGKLDLVTGDVPSGFVPPSPERIHVMLGNGDGTFQAATAWGPPLTGGVGDIRGVGDLCVRDFNGDGHPDIGYGSDGGATPDTVGIAWGAGGASFPTFTVIYTGGISPSTYSPPWLDAADIDGDADQDVVAGAPATPAAILRNNGNGTFAQEPFTSPSHCGHAFGELNGDGWPDIVTATKGGGGGVPGQVWVFLNDQTGHFPLPGVGYPVTTQPAHTDVDPLFPLVADLDGDGRAEVVIGREGLYAASAFFQDQTVVFHNAGNGTLEEPPALYHNVGGAGRFLEAADLNHDGHEDVLAVNWFTTTLLINDGEGGFLTAHGVRMGPTIPGPTGSAAMTNFTYLSAGDFNNDGRFDLVGSRAETPFLECAILLQDAQGEFTTLSSAPLPEKFTTFLTSADFNLDGDLDVVVTTQVTTPGSCGGDQVRVAFGNGDGTLAPWTLYHSAGKNPRHVAAGDLNGDTWPDLAVATQSGPNCPSTPSGPKGVSVMLNNQSGAFPLAVQYDCGDEAKSAAIGDLNGDTFPDLGVVTNQLGVRVLLNNGSGVFALSPENYNPHPGAGAAGIDFADLDGDGDLDMLITIAHDFFFPNSGGVAVALNNGNAVFQLLGTVGIGRIARSTTVVDLDSDGDLDLVTLDWGNGYGAASHIDVFLGNGNGTFGPVISYGGGGRSLIVADFDSDGRPDLGSPMGCSPDSDLANYAGFAISLNRTCQPCYPDCNGDSVLTVADFGCFQTKFVQGDPYADCNLDIAFTVADFGCFQTKFVQSCQ